MIVLQLVLFCALFTLMVKIGVGNNALNGLYFYPKPIQEKVYELGLTDRETVTKKRKRFMTAFFTVMAVDLILIIRVWNDIQDFWAAYSILIRSVMYLLLTMVLPTIPKAHSGTSTRSRSWKKDAHLIILPPMTVLRRGRNDL